MLKRMALIKSRFAVMGFSAGGHLASLLVELDEGSDRTKSHALR